MNSTTSTATLQKVSVNFVTAYKPLVANAETVTCAIQRSAYRSILRPVLALLLNTPRRFTVKLNSADSTRAANTAITIACSVESVGAITLVISCKNHVYSRISTTNEESDAKINLANTE